MRTGHRQRVATGQHPLGEPLRTGGIAPALVQHRFHGWVTARKRVADHDFIAIVGDIAGQITLRQRNAQVFQLRGHRRIHRLVTAFDLMTEFAGQGGHTAHESTGNAENVDLAHGLIVADANTDRNPCRANPCVCKVIPDTLTITSHTKCRLPAATPSGPTPQEAIPRELMLRGSEQAHLLASTNANARLHAMKPGVCVWTGGISTGHRLRGCPPQPYSLSA
ncbi:hypothetical protein D3C71_929220 [compost metagenome]